MRFSEDGPSIPDNLLDQCDNGRTVFFCGAGVSRYTDDPEIKLPNFLDLALFVADILAPKRSDTIDAITMMKRAKELKQTDKQEIIPLDQVFLMFQEEFGKGNVDNAVAEKLLVRNLSKKNPTRHKHIAKISQNNEGIPQIVTTNFDVLFEQAIYPRNIRVDYPPFLPDLSFDAPVAGITYLHGRVAQKTRHIPKEMTLENDFILSTSDLGKAYLSEAWATNFVRHLVSKHTVVFIGYSAEDPPIKYLLMGMSDDKNADRSNLYAFDSEESDSKIDEWEKKGIKPIFCSNYNVLWDTIERWADRSKNPIRWRNSVIGMTKSDPKILKPYQRGQVLHSLQENEGVKKFRNLSHSKHPEWINVFDGSFRTRRTYRTYRFKRASPVLMSLYSIDDDTLVRDDVNRSINTEIPQNDLVIKYGIVSQGRHRNIIDSSETSDDLLNWVCDNLKSPVIAWWVSQQRYISANLIEKLKTKLRSKNALNSKARAIWGLILECLQTEDLLSSNAYRHSLEICIRRYGWKQSSLREFSKITSPFFKIICRNTIPFPPREKWTEVNVRDVVKIRVAFRFGDYEKINIPDSALLGATIMLQNNLLQASLMIAQVDQIYETQTKTVSCNLALKRGQVSRVTRFHMQILQLLKMLNRLAKIDPKSAKLLVSNWDLGDRYFFGKLKLYGLQKASLFDTEEVFYWISKLKDKEFWCDNNRSELLLLIRNKWSKFDEEKRKFIIDKIFQIPKTLRDPKARSLRNRQISIYAKYLIENGCKFPDSLVRRLESIIASLDNWNDSWPSKVVDGLSITQVASYKDRKSESQGSWKDNQSKSSESEISDDDIHHDEEKVKSSFENLVMTDPATALFSLVNDDSEISYDLAKWKSLLVNWPKNAHRSLNRKLLGSISLFSSNLIKESEFGLGEFFRDNHSKMIKHYPDHAWQAFDHCIDEWSREGQSQNSRSSVRSTRSPKSEISMRSHAIAINRAVGKATQGLLMCIDNDATDISTDVMLRLNYLLANSGEIRNQCVAILGEHANWLHRLDPDWTQEQIFPLFRFDKETAESAWNGLLYCPELLSKPVFFELRDMIPELYPWVNNFSWSDDDFGGCAFLVIIMGTIYSKEYNLSYKRKIKRCINEMNEVSVISSIKWLSEIGRKTDNGWINYVVPFLKSTWPRSTSVSSSKLVWSWAMLLADTGDAFPDVYRIVKKFLVQMEEEIFLLRHFFIGRYGEAPLASRFPSEILSFIDIIIPKKCDNIVIELDKMLEVIVSADETLKNDPRYTRLLDFANTEPSLLAPFSDDFIDDIE